MLGLNFINNKMTSPTASPKKTFNIFIFYQRKNNFKALTHLFTLFSVLVFSSVGTAWDSEKNKL